MSTPGPIAPPELGFWHGLRTGLGELGEATGFLGDPVLRLGVTGLSRAGKTVFVTGLVHALIHGGRLPGFSARAEGRIARARLVPHPDDSVPRFAYEDHLAALTGPDRHWPTSTRALAALRLDIAYRSRSTRLAGLAGPAGLLGGGESRLRLDIVDYPGEWLLDLPLLSKSYREFSAETLARAAQPSRAAAFAAYRERIDGLDPQAPGDEALAAELAAAFVAALGRARAEGDGVAALPPGRLLVPPRDFEGAPMLVFAPLPLNQSPASGSLAALFERRYESYKEKIVRPFYAQHFARLDRQIVLVDLLSALNGGAAALADLETALTEILLSFRVGAGGVLSDLFAPRVRKVLFAATKADHLHHSAHGKLEAILRLLVRRARHRARGAGAEVEVLALSAVRATREVTARAKGEALPSVAGVPEAGERLGGKRFDGDSEAAIFPGDLPDPPEAAFALAAESLRFLRFRPPLPSGEGDALPQIRLDAALEFLLADALA